MANFTLPPTVQNILKRLIDVGGGFHANEVAAQLVSGGSVVSASNPLPTSEVDSSAIAAASATATGVLFTVDMSGYESVSVQTTSAGTSCTITYECSDDNTNWISCSGINVNAVASNFTPASTSAAAGILVFPRKARYFRARVSSYGSGTVTAHGTLHKSPFALAARYDTVGAAAHDAAIFGAPLRIAGRALTANYTAVSGSDTADLITTLVGALVMRPFSIPEADIFTGATPITLTTSDQALKAAASAGIRNYMTGLFLTTGATWTANTIQIRSATTVLVEFDLPAGAGVYNFNFDTPYQTAAAEALNILATGAVTGTCKATMRGYRAP